MRPIVSVIIPSLNTIEFIKQCLNSVISQTIENIEIICVDAGSTDGTLETIKSYAKNDKRIHLISSPIKSYGYQMNLGLKQAVGKYIGIVEPDDYVDNDTFASLTKIAENYDADVIKAQWYNHSENFEYKMNVIPKFVCGKKIIPLSSFKHSMLTAYLFDMPAAIWSGIYKLDFLRENNITFNETPGASFQDTGFYFKALLCCNSCVFVKNCYLHYRIDNVSSSVYSSSKDFCICDEIKDITHFLDRSRFKDNKEVRYILSRFIYTKYKWNLSRMSAQNIDNFKSIMKEQLVELNNRDFINKKYFNRIDYENVCNIISESNHLTHSKLIFMIKEYFWCLRYGGIQYSIWKVKKWIAKVRHG